MHHSTPQSQCSKTTNTFSSSSSSSFFSFFHHSQFSSAAAASSSNMRHSSKHTPRSPKYLIPCVVALSLFSLTALLLYKVDDVVSRTGTVMGHNLEPTPWHVFPHKPFEEENRQQRAYKIIQCSYLSCRYTTEDSGARRSIPAGVEECPEFFRAIRQDLVPWSETRISKAHVAAAQRYAAFRVVIVEGKMFVDWYYACVQSRAMFTVWGLLQLLKRYPGMVPDVDLMFDCMDKPSINRTEHEAMPLPLFRYCTTKEHFDIPFPDWSFWGWPEINIRPWHEEFPDIKQGSQVVSWKKKLPRAYWKGNPDVASPIRTELINCNHSRKWNAQIMRQDWGEAARSGFKQSKLSDQCNHRYKIYAEGYAWSVSLKYILSCGSVALIITLNISLGSTYNNGNGNAIAVGSRISKTDDNLLSMAHTFNKGDGGFMLMGQPFDKGDGNFISMGQPFDKGDGNFISMGQPYEKEDGNLISLGTSFTKGHESFISMGPTYGKSGENFISVAPYDKGTDHIMSMGPTYDKVDSNIAPTVPSYDRGDSSSLPVGQNHHKGQSSTISFGGFHDDPEPNPSGAIISGYDLLMGSQNPAQGLDSQNDLTESNAESLVNSIPKSNTKNDNVVKNKEPKTTKKAPTNNFPSNVKSLLSTGIFDGVQVKYVSWSREKSLKGIIKGTGYLCSCDNCKQSKALNAYEFERHAGAKTKHPNNHIYFENGKTIYAVVQELKNTPQEMLFDAIQNVTGSTINQKNFRIWKASYQAATRELQRIYGKDEVVIPS